MVLTKRIAAHSKRAWLVAAFLLSSFLLGGGGSSHPATELALQLLFAMTAILWFWLRSEQSEKSPFDFLVAIGIAALILALPALQLVPLPPAAWHSLPGREDEIAALQLVGAQQTWRPVSMVPSSTLASLLAMVPAVGMLIAVSRLSVVDRRPILFVVVAVSILTAILGSAQIAAAQGQLTLYSGSHTGWVTGFQTNRNHAAEVLLAGLVALTAIARTSGSTIGPRLPRDLSRRSFVWMSVAVGTLLLIAIVMTGSRAGIALSTAALAACLFITRLSPDDAEASARTRLLGFALLAALLVAAAFAIMFGKDTGLERVMIRFNDIEEYRERIWVDAVYALNHLWPFGIGMGGFMAAMFPAERLEFVDSTYPNRAHNDFLELGVEAGIFGYIVVLVVFICAVGLAVRHWRTGPEARIQITFAATVLIMLSLHSVVDYPLRSMSLSCLAGAACGMLTFAPAETDRRKLRKR